MYWHLERKCFIEKTFSTHKKVPSCLKMRAFVLVYSKCCSKVEELIHDYHDEILIYVSLPKLGILYYYTGFNISTLPTDLKRTLNTLCLFSYLDYIIMNFYVARKFHQNHFQTLEKSFLSLHTDHSSINQLPVRPTCIPN